MGHPLKFFLHHQVCFITSRTEDGLPFRNAARYDPLFRSILARAQTLFPVEILAFTLEANHLHMLLAPINPEDVPAFVGYVKQELAHLANYDSKRRKKTVWCDGYDSPLMREEQVIIYYMSYIYTQSRSLRNPLCNSFSMFAKGKHEAVLPRRNRQGQEVKGDAHTLTLDPISWLRRLHPSSTDEELRTRLLTTIIKVRGEGVHLPFISDFREQTEQEKLYVPTKHGRRLYGIFNDIGLRVEFLMFIKAARAECRKALAEWRKGNYHYPWPAGFFPPHAIRRANAITYKDVSY